MPCYVIRAGDTDMVKIGWANSPEQRLQDLQTGHYEHLHIVRVIETTAPIERWLHRRYASQHVRGEWYRFIDEMLTVDPLSLVPIADADAPEELNAIETFLLQHNMNATEFGARSVNDPALVHEMRRGRECRRAVRQKIAAFIKAHTDSLEAAA